MKTPPLSRYMTYQPWTIRQDAGLSKARAMMGEHKIRHLPVLERGKIVGILSDLDIARFERLRGEAGDVSVEDAMTQEVETVNADEPLDKVIDGMVARKHGCVVVVDRHDEIAGIFTTIDALQTLSEVLRRDALTSAG